MAGDIFSPPEWQPETLDKSRHPDHRDQPNWLIAEWCSDWRLELKEANGQVEAVDT